MNTFQNEKQLDELGMFDELVTKTQKTARGDSYVVQAIQRVPKGFVLHTRDDSGNTSVFIPYESEQQYADMTSMDGTLRQLHEATNIRY